MSPYPFSLFKCNGFSLLLSSCENLLTLHTFLIREKLSYAFEAVSESLQTHGSEWRSIFGINLLEFHLFLTHIPSVYPKV